jgi:hypothetical protein
MTWVGSKSYAVEKNITGSHVNGTLDAWGQEGEKYARHNRGDHQPGVVEKTTKMITTMSRFSTTWALFKRERNGGLGWNICIGEPKEDQESPTGGQSRTHPLKIWLVRAGKCSTSRAISAMFVQEWPGRCCCIVRKRWEKKQGRCCIENTSQMSFNLCSKKKEIVKQG